MITGIEIEETLSPLFDGQAFGTVGAYELLRGTARGALDPGHPRNRNIVLLDKAPRNSLGLVEYAVDLEILKPVALAQGNGRILYDVLNRGNKRANTPRVNGGPATNSPRGAADAGTGFLMEEGYCLVWSGWQTDVAPGEGRMRALFPVATGEDQPLQGRSRQEFRDNPGSAAIVVELAYPIAEGKFDALQVTVRQREADPRQKPAGLGWRQLEARRIEITRPPGFDAGAIYEVVYTAQDPVVMGIAFASVRDLISFFRHDSGANPLASEGRPGIELALSLGISQSGRFLRDFLYQGFNTDEEQRQVFAGLIPIVCGSRKTNINRAFSIPGQVCCQHEDHTIPGDQFPFSYEIRQDPLSGNRDGILATCQTLGDAPKIMQVDTDTEMWQARASLVVQDAAGQVALPENVRLYLMTGCQHNPAHPDDVADVAGAKLQAQQPENPLQYGPIVRALIKALDAWCSQGSLPPDSRFPGLADDTLVPPLPPFSEFPLLPGVTYNGLINRLRLLDHESVPPRAGAEYTVLINRMDSDGNGVAGVLHPFLAVPLATHTGWNLRAEGWAENELASFSGSRIPFARTRAERMERGDPRLSLEERYGTRAEYLKQLRSACDTLVSERLLLADDAERIMAEAAEFTLGLP